MRRFSMLRSTLRSNIHALATAGVVAVSMSVVPTPALAQVGGEQCQLRSLSKNIKTAILAMQATRYCHGFNLPYTADEATERLDDLRCGTQSSQMIDDLLVSYDAQYETIMKTDARLVVCNQATTIQF